MTWREDDFDELAAELRRRVGGEFTREAAELEQLADLQRRRRRSLADSARQVMHRGGRVTLHCGRHHFSGQLVSVGDDYLVLAGNELVVEALLDRVVMEMEPARAGGKSGTPASATFRARLVELEMNREQVTLLGPDLEASGVIEVVATDHLVLAGDHAHLVVPLAAIAALSRRTSTPSS